MVDVKESALKILANVEANERQVKGQLDQVRKQHAENATRIENMESALKEMGVMKTILIVASTQSEVAARIASALDTSDAVTA